MALFCLRQVIAPQEKAAGEVSPGEAFGILTDQFTHKNGVIKAYLIQSSSGKLTVSCAMHIGQVSPLSEISIIE